MPDALSALLADQASKDEALRAGLSEHLAFEELQEHRAWLLIEERLTEKIDILVEQQSRSHMAGAPVDQRKIDWLRGYVAGVKDLLALPSRIEKNFDKALDRAWLRAQAALAVSTDEEDA